MIRTTVSKGTSFNTKRKGKIGESTGDKAFSFVNYTFLTLILITVTYPLVFVLSASVSQAHAVAAGRVFLWPVGFTLDGYMAVFRHPLIMSGYMNSIINTVVGTALNVFLTMVAAYPLSRKDFYGRNVIMMVFTITMFINGGLIPTFMLVRDLGMINTRWSMIIPGALSVWNVILTRTFLQANIPDELLEASKMDGCSDFTFLFRVVIPLSGPILAVITLFYAIGHWNQFFAALIYLSNPNLFPLQLVLRDILIQNQLPAGVIMDPVLQQQMDNIRELLRFSLIVVASAPMLIVFPFVQRFFVKGVMIGAIKG
jgi:multiple sugar transport system permease protein/putative aldouronate transport system permease protein